MLISLQNNNNNKILRVSGNSELTLIHFSCIIYNLAELRWLGKKNFINNLASHMFMNNWVLLKNNEGFVTWLLEIWHHYLYIVWWHRTPNWRHLSHLSSQMLFPFSTNEGLFYYGYKNMLGISNKNKKQAILKDT